MMNTRWMAAGQGPPQLVGVDEGVGDTSGVGVGVGVTGGAHPAVVQASQQLMRFPTHAVPPLGALQ